MNTLTAPQKSGPTRQPIMFLIFAALIWLALYQMLDPAAEALVGALPVDRASHLGGALQFFFTTRPRF